MITGLIIVCAIIARDWVQGLYAVAATFIGLAFAYLAGFPIEAINLGLFGYKGVLCAILFSGRSIENFICALAAVLLSVVLVRMFHVVDVPPFTFPFVLGAWLVLWARDKIGNRQ